MSRDPLPSSEASLAGILENLEADRPELVIAFKNGGGFRLSRIVCWCWGTNESGIPDGSLKVTLEGPTVWIVSRHSSPSAQEVARILKGWWPTHPERTD